MLFRSNDTATTEIYTSLNTLSLHDALPISCDLVGVDQASFTCLIEGRDVEAGCGYDCVLITRFGGGINLLGESLQAAFNLTVAKCATFSFTNVFECGFCISHVCKKVKRRESAFGLRACQAGKNIKQGVTSIGRRDNHTVGAFLREAHDRTGRQHKLRNTSQAARVPPLGLSSGSKASEHPYEHQNWRRPDKAALDVRCSTFPRGVDFGVL